MAFVGLLTTRDQHPKTRFLQPARHHPAENADILMHVERRIPAGAFSGDHQNHPVSPVPRGGKEDFQPVMGLGLCHAVQIDPGID